MDKMNLLIILTAFLFLFKYWITDIIKNWDKTHAYNKKR